MTAVGIIGYLLLGMVTMIVAMKWDPSSVKDEEMIPPLVFMATFWPLTWVVVIIVGVGYVTFKASAYIAGLIPTFRIK